MDRATLIERLLALPGAIHETEGMLIGAEARLAGARRQLEDRETVLLATDDGGITGRNAEVRAAQLRSLTARERDRLQEAEESLREARRAYHGVLNEFSALRAAAKLLAAPETD
jgi:hypothetical protein